MVNIKELELALLNYPRPYATDVELAYLLGGSPDSRYGKIKRLLAQGKLLHIRRGLYCLTEKLGYTIKPHPYELAQYIYGPSYISLESALSFHQLIPEAVFVTTSVSSKRSKLFKTPLGQFDYLHLPEENFYTEVILIKKDHYQFMMASPWKAICDYVYCYKKDWNNLEPLEKSLRVETSELPELSFELVQRLVDYYHHTRINNFLESIYKKLKAKILI